MKTNIYYLGIRDKTVQYTDFFKGNILVISSNKENSLTYEQILNKKINYNAMENFVQISNFFDDMIQRVLKADPKAKFMPYNQATIEFLINLDKVVCVNDINLVKQLNNKPKSREILKGLINCLDYKYLQGKDISFDKVNKLFKNKSEKYVVQEYVGFGGIGTFVLTKEKEKKVLQAIKKEDFYSVSVYLENGISTNNTFMINKDNIVIFDGSLQKIELKDELLYEGWDFEEYQKFNKRTKNKFYTQTYKIAKKLQELGYIGIGGVDYLLKDNKIYFMEINPRFQMSSEELDRILQEKGFPSIFELQYDCFYQKEKFADFCEKYKKISM